MAYWEIISRSILVDASAKLASIAGLFLTIYAVYKIAQIRKSFRLKARFPRLATDLGGHLTVLHNALEDYEKRKDRFLEELYPCSSTLRWILPLTRRPASATGRQAVRQLRTFRYVRLARSESRARQLYNTLLEFEADLRNLHEETQWE